MDTLLDFFQNFSGPTPFILIFVILLLCGFGLPLPEDIVLFAAGMLSYYDDANIYIMLAVCFAGVIIGDTAVFTIGALYGRKLVKKPFIQRMLPPHRLQIVQKKLHEQGNKVIFAARFMPGLRTPIFFSAGSLHLPISTFLFYDGLAATVSVPVIVYSVFYFGEQVDHVVKVIKKVESGIVLTIVAVIAFVGFKIYFAHKKQVELDLQEAAKSTPPDSSSDK